MAGAGIAAGQVYGASDANGAYPARDKVTGGDLTATIFHLLGIPHAGTFHDREGREHKLTLGSPIYPILGLDPATHERRESTGDIARVPPFSQITLLNTNFAAEVPLFSGETNRPKGWRAFPLVDGENGRFGAALIENSSQSQSGARHVSMGLLAMASTRGARAVQIAKGETAFLAQEVRSPFAGKFLLKARVAGNASSRKLFDDVFLKHFTCRLQFFQFTTKAKVATERKELASVPFVPRFVDKDQAFDDVFELEKVFENPNPGGNFSFGLGMGVAIVIEKTSDGVLTAADGQAAFLRIENVTVEFTGKARIETVKV
jgi:hypothetical protein